MEIKIVSVNNEIQRKPEIAGYPFPEYEIIYTEVKVWVYAPERGGDFYLSFNIQFESDKPKKRKKQFIKTLERYLNVDELTLIPE